MMDAIQAEIKNFLDEKYVRVMFDYSSSGLWQKNGVMAGENWLPISKPLEDRIKNWVHAYDRDAWKHMSLSDKLEQEKNPHPPEVIQLDKLSQACIEHYKEQVRIAIAIKKELPGWTVIIYNEEDMDIGLPIDKHNNSEIKSGFELKI